MNYKRFTWAAAALFIFVFGYETLVHGFLLRGIYSQTSSLWRDDAQMIAHTPFNLSMKALLALWTTFVFARLFKDGGWQNGLKFGLYFGVLSAIHAAAAYYYLPISAELAVYWFIAFLLEGLLGGFLLGKIYHR